MLSLEETTFNGWQKVVFVRCTIQIRFRSHGCTWHLALVKILIARKQIGKEGNENEKGNKKSCLDGILCDRTTQQVVSEPGH